MKIHHALRAAVTSVAVIGAAFGGVAAQAAPTEYIESSAMAHVVADDVHVAASSEAAEARRIVGVAKALAAGFEAANAPRAAGDVARLASVLGFAAETPLGSQEVEAAYFDR